jgi:hypothetical protein
MKMSSVVLCVLAVCMLGLFSMFVPPVAGFPQGAPQQACLTMTPQHGGAAAQATTSPYQIKLSRQNYVQGQPITGKLQY